MASHRKKTGRLKKSERKRLWCVRWTRFETVAYDRRTLLRIEVPIIRPSCERSVHVNLLSVVPIIRAFCFRSVLTLRNRTLLRIEVPAIRPSCERSVLTLRK